MGNSFDGSSKLRVLFLFDSSIVLWSLADALVAAP
jgi:hypothetical protein